MHDFTEEVGVMEEIKVKTKLLDYSYNTEKNANCMIKVLIL